MKRHHIPRFIFFNKGQGKNRHPLVVCHHLQQHIPLVAFKTDIRVKACSLAVLLKNLPILKISGHLQEMLSSQGGKLNFLMLCQRMATWNNKNRFRLVCHFFLKAVIFKRFDYNTKINLPIQ